jgi:hypothetical protein
VLRSSVARIKTVGCAGGAGACSNAALWRVCRAARARTRRARPLLRPAPAAAHQGDTPIVAVQRARLRGRLSGVSARSGGKTHARMRRLPLRLQRKPVRLKRGASSIQDPFRFRICFANSIY